MKKVIITVLTFVFFLLGNAVQAQVSILKTAKPLNLNENYELKLADDAKGTSDFKIVVTEAGNLTISFETFAEKAYATLFNKDGLSLDPIKNDVISGNSYYTNLRWANNTRSQGLVLSWNTTTHQFKGNFTWKLDAGSYYLRTSRSTQGSGSAKLSIFLENKAEQERQFQLRRSELKKQLQAQKLRQEREIILTLVCCGAFIILIIIIAIRSHKKANERRKEYQPIFDKIFKERGFNASDIIWTNCLYKINDNTNIANIVIGVKNGTLSFFGGGSAMVKFVAKDEKVAFSNTGVLSWRKLLKENYDLFISDGQTAKCLFPKNNEYKFRHLYDIPINNIQTLEKKKKGKNIELNIECSDDNLIKLVPFCGNVKHQIEIDNTIMNVFERIKTRGILSNRNISEINSDICDIVKEDGNTTSNNQMGCLLGVLGIFGIIIGGAASRGARNWSRDR